MKTIILKLVFVFSISIFFFSCATDEDGIYETNAAEIRDISLTYTPIEFQIIDLINAHRASKGLKTLKTLNLISKEAIGHTNYMIGSGEVSHDNFDRRYSSLVKNVSAKKVGENVAYGYGSAEAVVNAWIKSEGHRRNIENESFTDFGISTRKDDNGRNYFTNIFVKR